MQLVDHDSTLSNLPNNAPIAASAVARAQNFVDGIDATGGSAKLQKLDNRSSLDIVGLNQVLMVFAVVPRMHLLVGDAVHSRTVRVISNASILVGAGPGSDIALWWITNTT